MKCTSLLALLVPALALAGPLEGRGNKGLTVLTKNGRVTGHHPPGKDNVREFLGIRYAQPATGNRRFKAPVAVDGKAPFEASKFSDDCPFTPSKPVDYPGKTDNFQEILNNFGGGRNNAQGEDCLSLNIWTKDNDKRKKGVLVFFYGGRWTIGGTNTPFYDGSKLAEAEDIIVVTVNYRVGILGFPGAPSIEQNPGLLDQRLAVQWVSDNINAFGGNKKKITIGGQSSGSASVDYWSYAYADDPIVAGLISISGTAFSFPSNDNGIGAKNWYNASDQLGCGDSGDVLACMQGKSFDDIKVAAAKVKPPPGTSQTRTQPAFQPVPDNKTVFSDYTPLATAGKFAKIPYLIGNNDYEAGFYKISSFAASGKMLNASDWDKFNLQTFTCPINYEATTRAFNKVPVWRYRYFGEWLNLVLYPGSRAYHGTDAEMVFGNSAAVSGLPDSPDEQKMQTLMGHAWATFVSDPTNGLKNLGWPEYDPRQKSLVALAQNNVPTANYVDPAIYDKPCQGLDGIDFYSTLPTLPATY